MTKLVLAEEEKRMEGQAVELAAILLQRKGDDPHEGVVSLLGHAFEQKTATNGRDKHGREDLGLAQDFLALDAWGPVDGQGIGTIELVGLFHQVHDQGHQQLLERALQGKTKQGGRGGLGGRKGKCCSTRKRTEKREEATIEFPSPKSESSLMLMFHNSNMVELSVS